MPFHTINLLIILTLSFHVSTTSFGTQFFINRFKHEISGTPEFKNVTVRKKHRSFATTPGSGQFVISGVNNSKNSDDEDDDHSDSSEENDCNNQTDLVIKFVSFPKSDTSMITPSVIITTLMYFIVILTAHKRSK